MKSIETAIVINATPAKIWRILMNFEEYSEWNPFIQLIKGEQKIGSQIEASIGLGKKGMTFQPTIQRLDKNKAFEWLGHLWAKGIFDGRHTFEIEEINEHSSKFIHKEVFKGILSGLIMTMIKKDTLTGFEAMNEALKVKAEQ